MFDIVVGVFRSSDNGEVISRLIISNEMSSGDLGCFRQSRKEIRSEIFLGSEKVSPSNAREIELAQEAVKYRFLKKSEVPLPEWKGEIVFQEEWNDFVEMVKEYHHNYWKGWNFYDQPEKVFEDLSKEVAKSYPFVLRENRGFSAHFSQEGGVFKGSIGVDFRFDLNPDRDWGERLIPKRELKQVEWLHDWSLDQYILLRDSISQLKNLRSKEWEVRKRKENKARLKAFAEELRKKQQK